MSPILKRDIHEQLRHAKRLALAAAGRASQDDHDHDNGGGGGGEGKYEWEDGHGDAQRDALAEGSRLYRSSYASGSNPRQGIGVGDMGGDPGGGEWREVMSGTDSADVDVGTSLNANGNRKGMGRSDGFEERQEIDVDDVWGSSSRKGRSYPPRTSLDGWGYMGEADSTGEGASLHRTLSHHSHFSHLSHSHSHTTHHRAEEYRGPVSKLADLRNLIFGSTPSLLLLIIGEVFTGQLLEHLARWRVFLRVDELFILVPMLGNLKGNLEMCLSARLGTSANIGELDHRKTRRHLVSANLTLLGLQALLISCLAALISFVLGLLTVHRLGDTPEGVVPPLDPGLGVGEDSEWHEGYTRPGWKQLVMVLATGMGSAGLSSAVLGGFMGSVIVLSRWKGVDPDNITPPLAACLGDLITLFILALLGAALVGLMDTPIPLLAVIGMSAAAAWFTRRVMRDEWVRNVAKGGWAPLIAAMLISSGTGMALERGVGEYRGFALLAIPMTGLTGSIGAIHANRLSTALHTGLHPASLHPRGSFVPASTTTLAPSSNPDQSQDHLVVNAAQNSGATHTHSLAPHQFTKGMTSFENALALYAIAFPCQLAFVGFVTWFGWIDLDLGLAGWVCFALTTAFSLVLAQWMTMFFWAKGLDPDSYTLPMHSALVDFVGQCLLMLTYEVCLARGMDVGVRIEGGASGASGASGARGL